MSRDISILVKGKVQGVWFRHFTQKEAEKLGLFGYVTNQNDGSVYIEVSGPPGQIELFTAWCRNGSPLSRVDQISVTKNENLTIVQTSFVQCTDCLTDRLLRQMRKR